MGINLDDDDFSNKIIVNESYTDKIIVDDIIHMKLPVKLSLTTIVTAQGRS